MSKDGWKKAGIVGFVMIVAEAAAPGTAAKMLDATKRTVDPSVDAVADTTSNHLVPAASNTVGAARDGLAETNLLGPAEEPAWAEPQAGE